MSCYSIHRHILVWIIQPPKNGREVLAVYGNTISESMTQTRRSSNS